MTHQRALQRTLSSLLAAALCLPASGVQAGAADELRDLVGAKGAGAEADLESRGWTHIDTDKSRSAAYSYWWNNGKRACIRVTTRDGRYAQLVDADASDCGQTRKESGKEGMSDGAKIAVGAAALLGIAALAHKSHHRDDRRMNERQTADFERGYRDGLYNNSYHNYDNVREYSDGYTKGTEERNQQSSYRRGNESRGGYQSYASVSDLAGRTPSQLWGPLEQRGFQLASDHRSGGNRMTYYYWNDRTRQCVVVHVRNDWVDSIQDIGSDACGR